MDPSERRGWHFKKEISLGDLLAFVSAAIGVMYAYATLDKRIAILEASAVVQKAVDTKQDDEAVRTQQRIDEQFTAISRKLDYLLERSPDRRHQ